MCKSERNHPLAQLATDGVWRGEDGQAQPPVRWHIAGTRKSPQSPSGAGGLGNIHLAHKMKGGVPKLSSQHK